MSSILKNKKFAELLAQNTISNIERDEYGNVVTDKWETGIMSFDQLMNGGIPKGHMIGLATEEGGGKTTLALQASGQMIDRYDKDIYYFDVEGGATAELVQALGFSQHLWHPEANPTGRLKILNVATIEQISQLFLPIIQDPDVALIVIDSTTALTDTASIEGEYMGTDNKAVGFHARMWSGAARNWGAAMKLHKTKTSVLLIHQARTNLANFHVTTEAARGRALKHAVSVDIYGTVGKWIDENGIEVKGSAEARGAILTLRTTKNRLTLPNARVKVPVFYGKGVSNEWAIREWLQDYNIVDDITGEVLPVLWVKGGGHTELRLPSGTYKVRGADETKLLLREHNDEIMAFIDNSGGLAGNKKILDEE